MKFQNEILYEVGQQSHWLIQLVTQVLLITLCVAGFHCIGLSHSKV